MEHNSGGEFDFLHGAWCVRHRRLAERLAGSNDWEEFDGTSTTSPILGGHGNIEDNLIHFPGGSYRAAALRSFDAETGEWAIWWLDQRNPHVVDVPVVGKFRDGVGVFLADDTLSGIAIVVRFRWLDIGADTCRWEQAFSDDRGESWETNWIMEFSRQNTVN